MKKKNNLLCVLLSFLLCMVMLPASAVNAATVITENKTGTEDGYDYELWKDSGTTSMTLTGGGTFSCEWSNINNALFRKGIKFDCTKTYQEIGNIAIDFEADYNPNGNSYLCVYGWTRSPLVEYYIVEAWGSWRPPGAASKGTVTIDGGVYDIYETTRENQPSIDGNTTFQQYWSVRQDKRTSGTINVGAHFAAWESMGMKMGKLYEAALNVEGYQSSGSAVIKKNDISVGGKIPDPGKEEPVEPDKDGYYFHSTFEDGEDGWTSRGDASINSSSEAAYKGSKSMSVENRTDSWNGTARSLSAATFVPGKSYSFSVMAMQNQTASEDFKLTLQYDLDGEANYSTVAEAKGAKNQWVQLSNTSYTIPAGASNMLLYMETADSTTSFYIDEAIAAPKGTVINEETKAAAGDVNSDGSVDKSDVIAMKKFLTKAVSEINSETADMNGDGIVNCFDLILLKRVVMGVSLSPDNPAVDISWIDPSKPMVAISFDDGAVGTASDSTSMKILNALSDSGFHSTFFYVGNWINSNNQAEVKKAYDMGMEIANHTNSHPYLTNLSESEIRSEYDTCAQKLKSIIGADPSPLIRLPYLASDSKVQSALSDAPLITCSIDVQDWNGATTDQIIDRIKTAMNNGTLDNSIVLCHETYKTTAEAMEYLCPYLKSQGWQIVTVSEMFAVNGKSLDGGKIYTKCN